MLLEDIDRLQEDSDGYWILSYAMIMSLAADLGKLRKMGLWKHNPNEMQESPWFHLPCDVILRRGNSGCKSSDWPDSPSFILRQYNETVAPPLCEFITGATNGKIKVSQSNVVYMAKQF
jgi:hypothetical protein